MLAWLDLIQIVLALGLGWLGLVLVKVSHLWVNTTVSMGRQSNKSHAMGSLASRSVEASIVRGPGAG